ncbi:histone-like nucleoid-structuring protein Lsr2 [Curtobacterium flaccumfaciens]|uniref:histone-like nucleoid-structuring protein Lsr2 n=1 Tax=Curtobacterium flaccumfaciens TaxID=2035 RepID=UPI0027DD1E13|nr:Lsr2 family protein [Curtobacterium flaccumfaciens]
MQPGPSAYPISFSPSRVLSHNYEIDLTDDNADALREAFSDYVAAARKVTGRAAPKRGNSEDLAKVREWANTNGHEFSSRGRISQAVRDAYEPVR